LVFVFVVGGLLAAVPLSAVASENILAGSVRQAEAGLKTVVENRLTKLFVKPSRYAKMLRPFGESQFKRSNASSHAQSPMKLVQSFCANWPYPLDHK